jgi:poly-gamma-glutamate capsule biosynthesis protein CapA/YwtB (metallophosphatase superfamily)
VGEEMKMTKRITFTATGDSFITRRHPGESMESFQEVSAVIQQAEVRFNNLEVTTHRLEGFPSATSGGTWAMADPEVLIDLKKYGFNVLAWANNHTLDYSYGGLEATQRYVEQYGFIHAGVGQNMAEASAPKYLECPSARVAIIAACSTVHESAVAGDQRPDMIGRPGLNPLRFDTNYVVSEERLEQLKAISKVTDINAWINLSIKEGFAVEPKDGSFTFGNYRFTAGKEEGAVTKPSAKDLDRILQSIEEAKRQADYVLVSIHAHEMKGEDKSLPADFLQEFSRKCIDQGAHAIIGHGPHILRGIEIYKGRPIFYSLGNFIFQNETVAKLPADFYEKYGLGHTDSVANALDKRTNNNTKGLGVHEEVWESVIPLWSMENGKLTELKLYPIELGFGTPRYTRGWPTLAKNSVILEKLKALCEPFGTKLQIDGAVGKIIIE